MTFPLQIPDALLDEVHDLTLACLSGTATPEDVARLDELACNNEIARRIYAQAIRDSFSLRRWADAAKLHPGKLVDRCDSDTPFLPLATADTDVIAATPSGTCKGEPRVTTPGSPFGFLGTTTHGTIGYFSSGWPVAYLAATVIFGVGLLVGALVHVSHPVRVARQSSPPIRSGGEPNMEPVGRITGMVDCRWGDPAAATFNGAHVPLGRTFVLTSGLMEITYDTGAKVILQGPVTYEVESRSGGFLSLGKLTARLEKTAEGGRRTAEGFNPQSLIPNPSLSTIHYPLFTIKTPTAIVTDLGTEFGVAVDRSGLTAAHVFRGVVEVQVAAGRAEGTPSIRLTENQSAQVDRQSDKKITVHRGQADIAGFVRTEQLVTMVQQRRAKLHRSQPSRELPIYDKTLVAWVSLDNLEQQGGAVLSLVNLPEFDGIVFGELVARKWMAGSHGYARTEHNQAAYPIETAKPNELVQIAIVYDNTMITIYRNGRQYAQYDAGTRLIFERGSMLFMGKRHPDKFAPWLNKYLSVPTLVGAIEEARFYDVALRPETIASLKPNEPSAIRPLGWWTFEDGTACDSMGYFPAGELHGNARITRGKLILDGVDSYLVVPAVKKPDEQPVAGVKAAAGIEQRPKSQSHVGNPRGGGDR